jgi:hypothetical protein
VQEAQRVPLLAYFPSTIGLSACSVLVIRELGEMDSAASRAAAARRYSKTMSQHTENRVLASDIAGVRDPHCRLAPLIDWAIGPRPFSQSGTQSLSLSFFLMTTFPPWSPFVMTTFCPP